MNTTRTALSLATVLTVASTPLTELRAQESSGPRTSCEAVFEALRGGDAKAFQATLPTAETLETALRAAGFGKRLDEPGAATKVRDRLLRGATERFTLTRNRAGKRFDWSSARFLTEIPPAAGKTGFEIAPLAFLVHADGQVWQFGGEEVMRIGSDWCFVEGPFFHGLCDPNGMEVLRAERDAAFEREQDLSAELDALKFDMRMRGDEKTRAVESLERKNRSEFEETMRQERESSRQELQKQSDAFQAAARQWNSQRLNAEQKAAKAEYSLRNEIDRLEQEVLRLKAQADSDNAHDQIRAEDDRYTIFKMQVEIDALRAAVKRLQPNGPAPMDQAQRQEALEIPLELSVPDISVPNLLHAIGHTTGVPIVMGSEAVGDTDFIEVGDEPSRPAKDWLDLASANHEPVWWEGMLWIGLEIDPTQSTASPDSPAASLGKMHIREDYIPAEDLLISMRDEYATRMWISNGASACHSGWDIELRSTAAIPIAVVLDLVADQTVTEWTMVDDVVYWHEEEFEAPSEAPPVQDQRRSFEREFEGASERFAALSKLFGTELRMGPKLTEKVAEDDVMMWDCNQKDISLATVLTLLELDLEAETGLRLQWRAQGRALVLAGE